LLDAFSSTMPVPGGLLPIASLDGVVGILLTS
jgi:hypothetical protein